MKNPARQKGVALFVVLIILLLITMMGISAMRSGIFHETMAFNTQVEEMTFQSAETAINGVVAQARRNDGNLLGHLVVLNEAKVQCFNKTNGVADGNCPNDRFLDLRNNFQSEARSQFDLKRPSIGNDADKLADFQFHTIGTGLAVNDGTTHSNLQEWRKIGPSGGPFQVPDQAGAGISAPAGNAEN